MAAAVGAVIQVVPPDAVSAQSVRCSKHTHINAVCLINSLYVPLAEAGVEKRGRKNSGENVRPAGLAYRHDAGRKQSHRRASKPCALDPQTPN